MGTKEAADMPPLQLNLSSGKTEMTDLLALTIPKNYITVMMINNHPFSYGICNIGSAGPKDKLIFDPHYLSHPWDLEILVRQT